MGLIEFLNTNGIIRAFQSTKRFRNAVEIRNPVWLETKGTIPTWLNGVLYRIGPGKFILGDEEKSYVIQHAFDGLTYAHRFEIAAGKNAIRYSSRFTAEGVEKNLLQDPSRTVFFGNIDESNGVRRVFGIVGRLGQMLLHPGRPIETMGPSDQNIGVTITPNFPLPSSFAKIENDDHVLVSKTDANVLQQIHSKTLEPKRLFDYSRYDAQLEGPLSAAHHQYDPETGEVFNFVLKFGRNIQFTVFSIDKASNVRILAEITHRKLPNGETGQAIRGNYVHSFWLTKNYVILPESPLYHTNNGIDITIQGAVVPALAWDETSPSYLHVIRRDGGGLVASVPVDDPFFTFHSSNAWESTQPDGSVVLNLDCCSFKNGDVIHQVAHLGIMDRKSQGKNHHSNTKLRGLAFPPSGLEFGDLCRYTVHLNGADTAGIPLATATCRTIAPNAEFPRIHPARALKPYNYAWACRHNPATDQRPEGLSLVKIDLETGNMLELDQDGHMFTEPVFVPRPGAAAEDDGVLLSFTNIIDRDNPEKDRCAMVIVDAASMKEVARADIGDFGVLTFHGSFVADVHFENISVQ
ncbi:carotenoid oxygenase [Dichotomocladium elegans]|nr:carotenoid oxygenase [Dichotomocladium elegans]